MFEDQSFKRTLFRAPPSSASLMRSLLEPTAAILTYVVVCWSLDVPVGRAGLVLCVLVLALTRPGHDRTKGTMLQTAASLVTAWLGLLAVLSLFAYVTSSFSFFEPKVLLWWAVATPAVQGAAVWMVKRAHKMATRPDKRRGAVIIGAGPLGVKVAHALLDPQHPEVEFRGYFDDRTDERVRSEAVLQRLGTLKDAAPYVRAHAIDEAYVTLPLGSQPRIVELLRQFQGSAASLFFVPDAFGISILQGRLQDMNGVPVVGVCLSPPTSVDKIIKRVSDVLLASALVVLTAPLLLVVAVGVKLSSPGPVIIGQRCRGIDGDEFIAYRFRSTRAVDRSQETELATGSQGRFTPIGAFLRRRSLDGLPQFINVLKGCMSIVGPRSCSLAHGESHRQLMQAHIVRHKAKSGMTGWAQVHGIRGETGSAEQLQARVEYDLEYLRNWSLGLDLQIIARTFMLIVRGPQSS